MLWNLTRNACRYGRGGQGSIEIVFYTTAEGPRIEVIDDGPGVAVDALAHLFEPFFTTDADGTGLGLYIASELAEVNAARIDYLMPAADWRDRGAAEHHPTLNRGACFRVTMRGTP